MVALHADGVRVSHEVEMAEAEAFDCAANRASQVEAMTRPLTVTFTP
jgi:hypothetical protein